jgi:hypothetical protein
VAATETDEIELNESNLSLLIAPVHYDRVKVSRRLSLNCRNFIVVLVPRFRLADDGDGAGGT